MTISSSLFIRLIRSASLLGLAIAMTGCTSDVMVNTLASRNTGIKQYNAGQYLEAAGTFRTTFRANPADYGSCYFLGASMAKMGSYELAIEKYKTTLILMDQTMVGKTDRPFRLQCLNSLAEAVVASKDRDIQSALIKDQPAAEAQFLMAKIHRGSGDADAAVEAYTQAALLAPHDFVVAKENGLYLLQLGQNTKARSELMRAYAMNTKDEEVAMGLRRVGVVPGPSLKNESDMAHPIIPVGPIPQIEIVIPASDRTPARQGE